MLQCNNVEITLVGTYILWVLSWELMR